MTGFLYNPDRKPKEELISEFVIRTDIYNDIMHDLETSSMKHPEQHYLLVGQRGSGKTTILNRLKYGIEDSKKLNKYVIPILFSEEQYNISELVNLWENIAQLLEDYYGFDDLYEQMESLISKKNFEELSYELLVKNLKSKGKKLVVLIDNIGDMLKKLDEREVRRFRSILQTDSEIRLIVGSPFYLETVLDYQQPLFEFFKVVRLDSLNQSETELLLLKLAEINGEEVKIKRIITETPERIDTLRTLTGGVPRTIALMYNIFIEFNNEDSIRDLEKILDAVTPLYKHRMDDLPTQQQKIVDAVAKNWDGISVKELKAKLRIDGKIISSQLRQLQKNQIIDVVDTGTKNNIYHLKERFFNIWYLMRYGRKYDQLRVIWLVKFLESWCSMMEIEQRIIDYTRKIKDGELDEQLINFYGEVYTAISNTSSEIKILLKDATPEYLSKRISIDDAELVRLATIEYDNKNYKRQFELLEQITSIDFALSQKILYYMFELRVVDLKLYVAYYDKFISKVDPVKRTMEMGLFEQLFFFVMLICGSLDNLISRNYEDASGFLDILMKISKMEYLFPEETLNLLIDSALLQFLKFDQPNKVFSVFEKSPEWKDKLRPTYYATIKMLKIESELLKMPPEMQEHVDIIIKQVNENLAYVNKNKKETAGRLIGGKK